MNTPNIFGFKRENGRVGIRNHVVILPLDDLSNAACKAVANNIRGALAIPHAYGRLQFGEDLELHFRTLISTGANPNVAAVVVIGIEPEWPRVIVDGIGKTGKLVTGFSIERYGDINTIAEASRTAKEYVHIASEYQREECPLSDVWVSHKCGDALLDMVIRTCNGRLTAAEALGHREFVLTKLYRKCIIGAVLCYKPVHNHGPKMRQIKWRGKQNTVRSEFPPKQTTGITSCVVSPTCW